MELVSKPTVFHVEIPSTIQPTMAVTIDDGNPLLPKDLQTPPVQEDNPFDEDESEHPIASLIFTSAHPWYLQLCTNHSSKSQWSTIHQPWPTNNALATIKHNNSTQNPKKSPLSHSTTTTYCSHCSCGQQWCNKPPKSPTPQHRHSHYDDNDEYNFDSYDNVEHARWKWLLCKPHHSDNLSVCDYHREHYQAQHSWQ